MGDFEKVYIVEGMYNNCFEVHMQWQLKLFYV